MYQTAYSLFGQGSGPIFLTNVHCSGSEMSLLECPRTVFVGTACTHSRDVGLRCQRKLIFAIIVIALCTQCHVKFCPCSSLHQWIC